MSYQYLFCASCGTRRTGHGYQCSVCGNLLRRESPRTSRHAQSALSNMTVQWQAPVAERKPQPERHPVAAAG